MAQASRRVGLGLGPRGGVRQAVRFAQMAAESGFDSVWLHETYFERDAITYLAAIASQVAKVRLGLGCLNPYTRHPVLLAMTLSALDDLAPGRLLLALGSGPPWRLAQMGIPFGDRVAKVSEAMDILRELWSGRQLRLDPSSQPLQLVLPPACRVPIFVAARRREFLELCGQKADGYLATPSEAASSYKELRARIEAAAQSAGRPPASVEYAGYLLCLVHKSRLEAFERAKREPFVIYMLAVLSDRRLQEAGFAPEVRDAIAAAWWSGDRARAAELILDEMLDAFTLCGTVEEVATRVRGFHEAGMDLPVLQPIVQEEGQVRAVVEVGTIYGRGPLNG